LGIDFLIFHRMMAEPQFGRKLRRHARTLCVNASCVAGPPPPPTGPLSPARKSSLQPETADFIFPWTGATPGSVSAPPAKRAFLPESPPLAGMAS
jgi:hypothetical protein